MVQRVAIISDNFIRQSGTVNTSAVPAGGTLNINSPSYAEIDTTIEKSGSPEGQYPFGTWQGANAAVLAYSGIISLAGGTVLSFWHAYGLSPNVITPSSPFAFNASDGFSYGGEYHAINLGPIVRGY